MSDTFKSWVSLGLAAKLSLFVVGTAVNGCALDPAPTQGPSAAQTGVATSPVTSSTGGLTNNATSGEAPNSITETVSDDSGSSGPKADCIGVNPEADPDALARSAYQDTGTNSETSSDSTLSTSTDEASTGSSSDSSSTTSTDSQSTSTSSQDSSSGTDSGTDSGDSGASTGEGGCVHPACIGDASVSWQLHDHQPLSCGFGQDYGQDAYYGKTTMVVFLAGWCNFCLRQTVQLEKMRIQWAREGKDISILIINAASANNIEYRSAIVDRTSNPVFQDTSFSDVWGAMAGVKDTFYIYDAKGILREYLVPGGPVNIDLSAEQGYAEIKRRAESVLAAQE